MYIINGKQFNITQIGQNRFRNEIKDPKEAQELAQMLHKLNKQVSKVSETESGGYSEIVITDKPEKVDTLSISKDGYNAQTASLSYEYQKSISAEDALYDNWTKSTGIVEMHTIGVGNSSSADASGTISLGAINQIQRYEGRPTPNATVKDPAVKGMERGDFLEYVRANGLDKEINWNKVEEYLNAPASFDNLESFADYAGAMYAGLEQRISNDFNNAEQETQLSTLNAIFDKVVNRYSKGYSSAVSAAFEHYGVSVDSEKLEQSVTEIMKQKREGYRSYVSSNSDYAGLSGSKDSWLERDVRYMTDQLRSQYSPATANKSGMLYSKGDVEALGYFAASQNRDIRAAKSAYSYVGSYYNEEKIGFSLAFRYLSAESVCSEFGVSEDTKKSIMDLMDRYSEEVIKGCNAHQKAMSEFNEHSPFTKAERGVMYGDLDKDAVFSVVNKTKYEIKKNPKNLLLALKNAGDFAYKQYFINKVDPEKSKLARYNVPTDKPEANFFHEFYDDGRGTSYIGKTIDKLNDFTNAVKNHNLAFLSSEADNSYFFSYKTLLGAIYSSSNN